jgi:hypothetical protein
VLEDGQRPPSGASDALIRQICVTCVESLPISGAAVSVMTAGGHRGVVAATDDRARQLEDIQFTVGEGPGPNAFATGFAVLVPDLGGPSMPPIYAWPAFAELSGQLGVRAVFAFPLHLGAASLGALTLYRATPGVLDGPDLARALRLSDAAAFALLDLMVVSTADNGDEPRNDSSRADDAEFFRSEIYQAAGMVMVQLGVTIEEAMVRLRSHAYVTGRVTGDVARDIVNRKLRLEADSG